MIEAIYHKIQEYSFDINGRFSFALTGILRTDKEFHTYIIIDPDLSPVPDIFVEILEETANFIFDCQIVNTINLSFLRSNISDKKLLESLGFREVNGPIKKAFEATYILDRFAYVPTEK